MIGSGERLLRCRDRRRRRILFPGRVGPQQGEVERREFDQPYRVAAIDRTGAVAVDERMDEPRAVGIGMAIDQGSNT